MADLGRFIVAQDEGGTYERALAELRAGRKTSHWMWFVFPQLAGLGLSATAQHYALASVEDAAAYFEHQVLGPRLKTCAEAIVAVPDRSAEQILGSIDAMKLRSSATLFELAVPGEPVFGAVLDRFFGSQPDPATLRLL